MSAPRKQKEKNNVWSKPVQPIRLKRRLLEAGISQGALARDIHCPRSIVNAACNRAYIPPTVPLFKTAIETYLQKRGISIQGIWQPESSEHGASRMKQMPRNHATHATHARKERPGGISATPATRTEEDREMIYTREQLTPEELAHFGLNDDPFTEIDNYHEIWLAPRAEQQLTRIRKDLQAHRMVALLGEAGAGKSTLLRHLVLDLQRDDKVRLIWPDNLDRDELRPGALIEMALRGLGCKDLPRSATARNARVKLLLEESVRSGLSPVLIIDEAHDLRDKLLVALKRLWDSGNLFRLIGILLVGQGGKDDEGYAWGLYETLLYNPDIREFSMRCKVELMADLNGDLGDYVAWRIKRAGGAFSRILTPGALAALGRRAKTPQLANALAVRALRAAHQVGSPNVTADHVNGI